MAIEWNIRYYNFFLDINYPFMEHSAIRRLHPDSTHFVVISGREVRSMHDDVRLLINKLGSGSSAAQGLPHVITSFASFAGSDNIIYILLDSDDKRAVGFVKIGPRNLFLWDRIGVQHEMKILCLLDFFTLPECQRKGFGKKMIDRVLADHHVEMHKLPIDRPSSLCLSFMKKQFGLSQYMPQSNNFVVFDEFWDQAGDAPQTGTMKGLLSSAKPRPRVIAPVPVGRLPNLRTQPQFNPITWAPMD
jgi:alpha-tubulin N-acetyltransferase 1